MKQPPFIPQGIPFAWRQLVQEKKRFAVALLGVAFAVILMVFQLGIYEAFVHMITRPIMAMKGDLAIVSKDGQYFLATMPFPERRLFQALAAPGVKEVYPVMMANALWRNPETGYQCSLGLFGVRPERNPIFQKEVVDKEYILSQPGGIFYDRDSSPDYGDVTSLLSKHGILEAEINDQRVRVMSMYDSGRTLGSYGHALVGMQTFSQLTGRPSDQISVGMIELHETAVPQEVARQLTETLPNDVKVLTRAELTDTEVAFWKDTTPVGFIVAGGMVIAMLVGAVIVYQILYTDISDHIKEYATLKALGLSNKFFLKLILQQSAILLGIGFVPGLAICELLFRYTVWKSGIPTYLSLSVTLIALVFTALMCMGAGYFATRRLYSADPAEIF